MYYDISKLLSYNAYLNFIIGGRGRGKTYGITKFVIKDFINNGHQFVYIRRKKTQLDKSAPAFFKDMIKNEEFGDTAFQYGKNGNFLINGEVAGYTRSISTAGNQKSIPLPDVYNIIFDEFMCDSASGYLPNEVVKFLELVSTILRLRNGRVFLISNALSITNPYFTYFNLELPYNSEFKLSKDGNILVQMVQNNPAFDNAFHSSRFGQIIEGTKYADYAIDNKFLLDSKTFIKKKTGNCKFWFNIKVHNYIFGIWCSPENDIFVSSDFDKNSKFILTLSNDDHTENTILIKSSESYIRAITTFYRNSKLFFESQCIKNEFMEVFKHYLRY